MGLTKDLDSIWLEKNYQKANEMITTFMDKAGAISATDSKGRTLLHMVAEKGYTEIVKFLLAKEGIDVN